MPKTKFQGVIFGLIMSYSMAYGMEVYNIAIKMGVNLTAGGFSNMTDIVFWEAFKEALYMGVFVFIFSNLWGNKFGASFAAKHTNPEKDNPYICQLLRQAGTVAVMCPTMSMVASILFNLILGGANWWDLPAIWVGTVLKNFPMAFFWNMFAAAPFSRFLFSLLFKKKNSKAQELDTKK
ncbi:MAG: DUF2798 domain-containing protein [Clostridiales bacterium]|nr:DUF2798 domain-containing protein [Clostridiales bacterium]